MDTLCSGLNELNSKTVFIFQPPTQGAGSSAGCPDGLAEPLPPDKCPVNVLCMLLHFHHSSKMKQNTFLLEWSKNFVSVYLSLSFFNFPQMSGLVPTFSATNLSANH